MNRKYSLVIFFVALVLTLILSASALAAPPHAPAATYTWNGGTGNWSVATNWTPNGVPGSNDTATITGGTVDITASVTVQNLILSGGTLQGSESITVTQAMAWSGCATLGGSGATTIGSSAMLTVTWGGGLLACPQMTGRTLNILGGAVLTKPSAGYSVYLQGGAVISNTGTLDLQDNTQIYAASGAGSVNNAGLLRKVGGAGAGTLDGVVVNNTGTVQVLTGTLSFSNFTQNSGVTRLNGGSLASSGSPLSFYGGTLQGAGTVNGNVANIGGTVSPGNSPGVLRIVGNYTQGPTGTLNIEVGGTISGTQYDLLDVTGNATLSGTLDVSLINGFTPISGTVFRVMNFGARSGDFITNTGSDLGNGMFVKPYYSADHLSLIAGTPVADLSLSLTDGKTYAVSGDPITYTLVITNAGPDAANGALITDTLPGTLSGVTWMCVASGGSCGGTPSGSGNLSTTVNVNAGGVVTFTIGGRLALGASGMLVNTAGVAHFADPDSGNNRATDSDIVLHLKLYLPLVIR